MSQKNTILVTGGAGFIGSEFVRQAIQKEYSTVIVDKLTYSGDLSRLDDFKKRYKFYQIDIADKKKIASVFKKEKPSIVINFAAETHVDRAILDIKPFIETNITGTQTLIDACIQFKIRKFVHISTDEVYGDSIQGKFPESAPLKPNNPYSATKASAEFLVRAAIRTHRLPAIIIRPANNYGYWQYPEKLIPVVILKAMQNQPIPVYGKGEQIREWLHVSDCAEAIHTIIHKGDIGEIYNIGTYFENPNIITVKTILDILNKPQSLIKFVKDRPGHDFRYSVNYSKLKKLGWKPQKTFTKGIKETVDWYVQNVLWIEMQRKNLQKYWKNIYKNK